MKPKYVESATCLIGGCDCPAVALDIPDIDAGQAVLWCENGHVVVIGPDEVIRKKGGFRLVFDFSNEMKPCEDTKENV
jgi:hypothetical protein